MVDEINIVFFMFLLLVVCYLHEDKFIRIEKRIRRFLTRGGEKDSEQGR